MMLVGAGRKCAYLCLLITSYNPLAAKDEVRRTAILRELGRSHATCIQGLAKSVTDEPCIATVSQTLVV